MPGFLVLLFWLWLAVSIGVYAYRFFTTGSVRAAAPEPDDAEPEDRYAAFEAQLAAMPRPDAPVMPDLTDPAPSTPDSGPGFEAFSPAPPIEDLLAAAPEAPVEPVTEPMPIAEATPTPVPDAAPAPEYAEPAPVMQNPSPIATMAAPPMVGDAVRAMTLAEALEGIEMPADLIPVGTNRFNPRHMQFFTDAFAPGDVGAALADELERLGFAIAPIDDTAIRVEQAHAAVEVRILPDRGSIVAALGERGEALPPDSVVVDFQLG
ncbi:MAG: hypothetical protein AAGE98_17540 [Actinomycetota bacterium]